MVEVTAYIGLGSNLGDRKANILRAIEMLSSSRGIQVETVSTLIETDPIGLKDQPRFINGVAEIKTSLDPFALSEICLAIEKRLGRVRSRRWSPRVIDLDILLFGKKAIRNPQLTIPHPEIANRPFVQASLHELSAHG